MFRVPVSLATGKPCKYRLVMYFEEKVVFNGQYQDKRMVLHAADYEADAAKAFATLQRTLINTQKGKKPYRFKDTLDAEGKRYDGIATFKSGTIYDTYTDKAIFTLNKYDKVDIPQTDGKKKCPELPNEAAIKNLSGDLQTLARRYWRSKGYYAKRYSSMGGGSGLNWFDPNGQKVC